MTDSEETIIFPLHPRTRKIINQDKSIKESIGKNINIIEPVGYFDMICLEANAKKIVTDSGGVQKEAYFCGIPCITLFENTAWVETVEKSANKIVEINPKSIKENIIIFNTSRQNYTKKIFGDGKTSEKIVNLLYQYTTQL